MGRAGDVGQAGITGIMTQPSVDAGYQSKFQILKWLFPLFASIILSLVLLIKPAPHGAQLAAIFAWVVGIGTTAIYLIIWFANRLKRGVQSRGWLWVPLGNVAATFIIALIVVGVADQQMAAGLAEIAPAGTTATQETKASVDSIPTHSPTRPPADWAPTPTNAQQPPGEILSIPSDPKATYYLISAKLLGSGEIVTVTRRDGPSGVSFSKRLIDCDSQTYVNLGTGDTLEEMKANEHPASEAEMSALVAGSISWYMVQDACSRNARDG